MPRTSSQDTACAIVRNHRSSVGKEDVGEVLQLYLKAVAILQPQRANFSRIGARPRIEDNRDIGDAVPLVHLRHRRPLIRGLYRCEHRDRLKSELRKPLRPQPDGNLGQARRGRDDEDRAED